ncbi:hypothetical protein ACU4GD_41600 [Cupriavidus basilensis]
MSFAGARGAPASPGEEALRTAAARALRRHPHLFGSAAGRRRAPGFSRRAGRGTHCFRASPWRSEDIMVTHGCTGSPQPCPAR